MTDYQDLTGYYTYRSFLNRAEATGDFNDIRFGEGELFLRVAPDGTVSGTLTFPADPLATEKAFLDVTGRVVDWSPATLELQGIGRPGTGTEEFDYKYQVELAPTPAEAVRQRPTLVGTVVRAKPHGSAPAGVTASVLAVQRDFLMPRELPGVALIPAAVEMLASRRHRLQHAVWHTVRSQWHTLNNDQTAVEAIRTRGWWPERPPFLPTRTLDLENGAGEDFLFMHRRMIAMLQKVYADAQVPPPMAWTNLPSPAVPQTVYTPASAGGGGFVLDPRSSGDMVPPPGRDDNTDRMFKSPQFLTGLMRPLSNLFRSPRFLSGMTLGQLGNLLEFTIHGWMHVRWTYVRYDSESGDPIGRSSLFDIDPKWDAPSNDDLGDFYSSHVHPTFWRLHGWIDDRINDWAAANTGRVAPTTLDGVPWFTADGELVVVNEPFTWPAGHHDHHGSGGEGGHDHEVSVMEEVMEIMRQSLEGPAPESLSARDAVRQPARLAFREILLAVDVPDEATQE